MHRGVVLLLLGFSLSFLTAPSEAAQRQGPLQFSGSLESQNLFKTPTVDQWIFAQQRNTLRMRFDLDIINNRKGTLGFDIPGVRQLSGFLLLRPTYDSVYDIRPGGRFDLYPRGKGSSFNDFPKRVRDSQREDGADLDAFHEVYIDLTLSEIPLSFRIGKQQVVWGESDDFRMLDRVNPLDLTWNFSFEDFERIRKPLWMAKALYRIPDIGPISEAFIEGYWGLGDWTPAETRFSPYPLSLPQSDPFINPATCTDPSNPFTCQKFSMATGTFGRKGDYDKNPIDNGQWGMRFVFNTPQGVQLGLHYFYQRFNFDDSSQATQVRAQNVVGPTGDPATDALIAIGSGVLPAAVKLPYIHTIGLSANYFEESTATVFRAETIYEIDLPFSDSTKPQLITNPACLTIPPGPTCGLAPRVPSGLFGATKADMWNGMVGFDRPTWIRWISRQNTILFTGQFFWHYMVNDPSNFQGLKGTQDKIRRWEIVSSLVASGLFGPGGRYRPRGGLVVDPMNEFATRFLFSLDYFVTNEVIVTPFVNWFVVPGESRREIDQPWPTGGTFRKQDQTGMRVTYQW